MNTYPFHTETNPGLLDLPRDLDGEFFGHEADRNRITDGYQRPPPSSKTFAPADSAPPLPPDHLLTRRITDLRNALHALFSVQSLTEWKQGLVALFIQIQWFTGFAHSQRSAALIKLGTALEKHIADLHHDSAVIDSSTSRRLAHAVDLMITAIQTNYVAAVCGAPTPSTGRDQERKVVPGDN